jgi:hypothetical protein
VHLPCTSPAPPEECDHPSAGIAASTAQNLQDALRIRLSILSDNVRGYVTANDLERRDRYGSIATLLSDMSAGSSTLPPELQIKLAHLNATVEGLSGGLMGARRAKAEREFDVELAAIQAELRGEEELPPDYCGSCYGAGQEKQCCNSCDSIRTAYKEKRWGFPDPSTFEQCRREAKARGAMLLEGEGCNLYGTMEVARVTGTLHIAPLQKKAAAQLQRQVDAGKGAAGKDGKDAAFVSAFNVTHQIKRLSFGKDYPGQTNPLDGVWQHSPSGAAVARYFLKVVPTTYEFVGAPGGHS